MINTISILIMTVTGAVIALPYSGPNAIGLDGVIVPVLASVALVAAISARGSPSTGLYLSCGKPLKPQGSMASPQAHAYWSMVSSDKSKKPKESVPPGELKRLPRRGLT